MGALSSLRVLEYGSLVSAPFCGKMLANMGAEVIKIEAPNGDEARRRGPFAEGIPDVEASGLFLSLNTGKLGVTLSMDSASGVRVFKDLVANVDVLIEANAPRRIEQLGIGYDVLRKINPGLIMTSISPFGQTGCYRDYKGGDLIAINTGGLAFITPRQCGDPAQEPLKPRDYQSGFLAGLYAALGTMAACYARNTSGVGQHVDVSEQESVVSTLVYEFAAFTFSREVWTRVSRQVLAPFHFLRCKDRYILLICPEEYQWESLVKLMGNPDWADTDLFKGYANRAKYWDSIEPLLSDWLSTLTAAEFCEAAQAKSIPCAPVSDAAELVRSEQMKAREFLVEIDHPRTGKKAYPGAPARLSSTPWSAQRRAPLLGEHNSEIFCDCLNYDKQDLVKMRELGII